MWLEHFEPGGAQVEGLIGRAADVQWLEDLLSGGLAAATDDQGKPQGLAACLLGAPGAGKSAVARRACDNLFDKHAHNTLLLEVDCRRLGSVQRACGAIALAAQIELDNLRKAGAAVARGLPETVAVLVELTRHERYERRSLHLNLRRLAAAMELAGNQYLLHLCGAHLGISLELERREIGALQGECRLGPAQQSLMVRELLKDLRRAGLNVMLLLDHLDQLRHSSWDLGADGQAEVRELCLRLCEAPAGLILCLRSGFAGLLPAELQHRRTLSPLAPEQLWQIASDRIARHPPPIRAALERPGAQRLLADLARIAPTPAALLGWFGWAAENDLLDAGVAQVAEHWLRAFHPLIEPDLRAVLPAFADARRGGRGAVTRAQLLAILDSEQHLARLLEQEAILPGDPPHPEELALDPELVWLLPQTA